MHYLPISINIATARILIVGGGQVATHKAQILSRFTNEATVIAPTISDEIKALQFRCIQKEFEPTDLADVNILFVCTGNHALNAKIKQLAAKQGILASVCDNPALCDFVSPAIHRHDNITIAVGSDAQDVKRSIRIRDRIRQLAADGLLNLD